MAEVLAQRRRRSSWAARVLLVLLLLVVAALAAAGWLVWRGLQARDALLAAEPLVARVQEQVTAGDAAGARGTLEELQGRTTTARESTSDPLWWLAARLPEVGDDVAAVRAVTQAVDDVAQRALPPLVEAAGSLDPASLTPVDGAIDLASLQAAAPALQQADDAMQAARADVEEIELAGVHPRVAGPVADLRAQLGDAASTTATGARAAALVPGMLGAERPRTYLVLFQNNAEVRATGGIPGALAVVRADAGRIELVEQLSSRDFPRFDEPVLPLSPEMAALHTDLLGQLIQDVNFTPHFPTSAQLAREMWRRTSGQVVDGVLSIDPVALSYLLEATGPLPLPTGGELTADNAVDLLLSQVYAEIAAPAEQDLFFASAATAVLAGLTGGTADPVALVDQMATAAGERRLLVWSADPAEQDELLGTVLEGALGEEPAPEPVVGVYLNDGTEAKMSYYLRHSVRVVPLTCRDDQYRDYLVQVEMTSTAPEDAATSLPEYVVGPGTVEPPLAPGMTRTNVLVYGPLDGGVVTVRQDGEERPFTTHTERGRPVGLLAVDLRPGQTSTIEVELIGPDAHRGQPTVRTTPGIESPDLVIDAPRCSSA